MRLYDSSELFHYLTEVHGMQMHDATVFLADLNDYFQTLGHLKDNAKPLPTEEEEDCL
jgi:hypothetical protein